MLVNERKDLEAIPDKDYFKRNAAALVLSDSTLNEDQLYFFSFPWTQILNTFERIFNSLQPWVEKQNLDRIFLRC